jgi:hypothetical protein
MDAVEGPRAPAAVREPAAVRDSADSGMGGKVGGDCGDRGDHVTEIAPSIPGL